MKNGLRQKTEGSWEYYIWVRDPEAKRGKRMDWRTGHGTHEQVKDLRTKEQAEAFGKPLPVTDRTVREQWQIWLDGPVRMKSGRREQQTKADLGRLHVLPSLGDHKTAEVTAEQIQTLLGQLLDGTAPVANGYGPRRPLSPTTVEGVYRKMRTFFNHWSRVHKLPSPMADGAVVPPTPLIYEGEYWTIEQATIAFNAMEESPVYWPARISYFIGLRASEIAGLGAEYVSVMDRTVQVEWSLERMKQPVYLKEPKSLKSRRLLPVSAGMAAGLQGLLEKALSRPATLDPNGREIHLLFGNEDGSESRQLLDDGVLQHVAGSQCRKSWGFRASASMTFATHSPSCFWSRASTSLPCRGFWATRAFRSQSSDMRG